MELTDENLDYEDCRPPRESTVEAPDRIKKLIEARKAKRAASSAKLPALTSSPAVP